MSDLGSEPAGPEDVPPPAAGQTGPFFRFSTLRQQDRQSIVNRAGYEGPGRAYVPANLFQLTALGANLDLDGSWPPVPQIGDSLAEWRHVSTLGRDQYVRVVYYGYLFPLGHRAVMVTVSDRIFVPDPAAPQEYADAYLQYKTFIRVTEPTKTYPATGQPFDANSWPFASAQILTLVTPDLDPGTTGSANQVHGTAQAFFPTFDGGQDVQWSIRLFDDAGTEVNLRIPLAFVQGKDDPRLPLDQFSSSDMQGLADAYNGLGTQAAGPSARVFTTVPGTPIRFAPEVTQGGAVKAGFTTHPTLGITLGAATPESVPVRKVPMGPSATGVTNPSPASSASLEDVNQPAFYPTVLTAWVRLRAAEALSRSSFDDGSGPGGVAIGYYAGFVSAGFPSSLSPTASAGRGFDTAIKAHTRAMGGRTDATDRSDLPALPTANLGSVYGGLVNAPQLNFPADAVGGLSNPNLLVSGLSAAAGSIGGSLSQYADKATALIQEYFGGLSGTLSNFLGGLPLGWLTSTAAGALIRREIPEGPVSMVPGILGDFIDDLGVPGLSVMTEDDGTEVVTYTQQASLQAFPSSEPVFQPSAGAALTLTAVLTVAPSGLTTFTATGTMDPFTITVLGAGATLDLIQIPFGNEDTGQPGVTFSASTGAKSSFVPNIGQPTFQGVLTFVNTLEQFLEDLGGSGFSVDVAPTQVSLSLSLTLPSVGCGVFTLANLGLSAGVTVPFLGGATVATFGFCSQEQPFTLTVMCFGGGGYFLLGIGLTEIQSLTASLDFEGQFALDIVVASGSVSLTAGITFSYGVSTGASITAFVNIMGEVEVIGILSISLQLDISLTYDFTSHVLTGTATMEVSVSIAFFSVSVGITVSKSFGGGGSASASLRATDRPELDPAPGDPTYYPPTFANQFAPSDWSTYCAAFGG